MHLRHCVRAQPQRLAQLAGVALVRLHALGARVHRREAGIGDDHGMAQRLQVTGNPLAFIRGLKQNTGGWPVAEDRGKPLAACDDAALDQLPVVREDAQLLSRLWRSIPMLSMAGFRVGFAALTAFMLCEAHCRHIAVGVQPLHTI